MCIRDRIISDEGSDDEFFKIESNKRLPKNIMDDEVKEERERAIDLCQKYRKIAKMIDDAKIDKSDKSRCNDLSY